MSNVDEYNVKEINGDWINGPMKWIVLIFGPNHQAKDLRSINDIEYKNLNIIVILVTNNTRNENNLANNFSKIQKSGDLHKSNISRNN